MADKYYFVDGTPYSVPTCKLPDGRIVSGATYTTESRRVHLRDDLPEQSTLNAVPSAGRAGTRRKKVKDDGGE